MKFTQEERLAKIQRNQQEAVRKGKVSRIRLVNIKRVLQGIPKRQVDFGYWDSDYERGVIAGRTELANELRKYVEGNIADFTLPGALPGNVGYGVKKPENFIK